MAAVLFLPFWIEEGGKIYAIREGNERKHGELRRVLFATDRSPLSSHFLDLCSLLEKVLLNFYQSRRLRLGFQGVGEYDMISNMA